ncbi:MAG: hypothetical protein RL118_1292 [Actinomycetota bacterium]
MALAVHSNEMTITPERAELNRLFEEQAIPLMPELYKTAMKTMNYNAADAEDLLQEVYIKAFRAFHQYEQGTKLKAWMTTILENTAKNIWSKRNRDKAQRGLDDMEDWQIGTAESVTAMPSQSAEFEALQHLPASAVKDALAKLPDTFREVVYYAIVEEYTYAQIAQITGADPTTVGTRLFRGKKLLRKYLEEYARQEGYLDDANDGSEGIR